MVLTDDEAVYSKMEYYHDHGHVHSKVHDRGADAKSGLGVNYRLSEIQGALGLVALDKMSIALKDVARDKKKILDAVAATGIKARPMHDNDGDTATHIIFLLPLAGAAKKFQAATKEAGCPAAIIGENTWHYAKHWKALKSWATGISSAPKNAVLCPEYYGEERHDLEPCGHVRSQHCHGRRFDP